MSRDLWYLGLYCTDSITAAATKTRVGVPGHLLKYSCFLMSQCNRGNMIRNRSRDSLSRRTCMLENRREPVRDGKAPTCRVCRGMTVYRMFTKHRLRSGRDSDSSLHYSGKELGICHSSFCYWVTSMLGNRLECCMLS